MNRSDHHPKRVKPEDRRFVARIDLLIALCALIAICGEIAFRYDDTIASASLLGIALILWIYKPNVTGIVLRLGILLWSWDRS